MFISVEWPVNNYSFQAANRFLNSMSCWLLTYKEWSVAKKWFGKNGNAGREFQSIILLVVRPAPVSKSQVGAFYWLWEEGADKLIQVCHQYFFLNRKEHIDHQIDLLKLTNGKSSKLYSNRTKTGFDNISLID